MQRLGGWLYPAGSARRTTVVASVDDSGELSVETPDGALRAHWAMLQVSDRVGDIPRRLTFPGGEVLESADNDAIDRMERRWRRRRAGALLHLIEQRWRWALGAVAIAGVIGWLTVTQGVPYAARRIAFALPADTLASTSAQTLAALDRLVFHKSTLPEARQAQVAALLARVAAAAGVPARFRLESRDGGRIGANAFALPDGTIVVTDQLVELAENDEQILAVLAHEIGHVDRRHGLQRMAQSAALALVALFVLGDVSQVLGVLPTTMIESAYSRDFEREADSHAIDLLNAIGVPPSSLARFLERLQASHGREPGLSWLASHPSTPERVRAIWNRAQR